MFGKAKWLRERFRRQWGKNPLEGESRYDQISRVRRLERTRILQADSVIDEITWSDLEMDEVFWRVNNTKSFVGEQVLYRRLHTMQDMQDWERYERQLGFLSEEEDRRVDLEMRLHAIGKAEENYSLEAFLMNTELWRIQRGWMLRLLQILLLLFGVTAVVWKSAAAVAGLCAVALTNLMIYLYMKQRYEGFLGALGSLKQIYEFVRWLTGDERLWELFGSETAGGALGALKGLSGQIGAWSGRKYAGMTGDIFGIVSDYLWGVTLLDVASFNRIMKVIGDRQDEVLTIVRTAGEVDAALAVASYRVGVPKWCVPQFSEEPVIRSKQIVHPLLEHAEANDFVLKNRAIIAGANASGKSTFMKALAVNAILAQTIHTCCAEEFSVPRMRVMSCMSLRDDIATGESYYFREAKYIRRMLDQMERGVLTLYVFDEILKGTNTRERLAASSAILEYIVSCAGFVLVSTHDMELTGIAGYANYYFESSIEGTDVTFDYRIHEGIGGSSNAIALLAALHYPDAIVRKAKKNVRGNA